MCKMFQPPNNFDCSLLDSLLYVSVCLVMESAKLHLVLQMWPGVQNKGIPLFGICNFFFPADYKLAHIGQDVTNLFSEDTLPSLVPSSHQHLHVLFCKVLCPVNTQPILLHGVMLLQLHDFAFAFKSSASFFLQAFRDQLSDRQPCPPAYQPVPCNLMPYIMSYSQKRKFIFNGERKFIHLHTDFWHSLCLRIFPFIFRSVFSFSKRRQAAKMFVLCDSLFSDIMSVHASLQQSPLPSWPDGKMKSRSSIDMHHELRKNVYIVSHAFQ